MCKHLSLYDSSSDIQKVPFCYIVISTFDFDGTVNVESSDKMHHKEEYVLSKLDKIIKDDRGLDGNEEAIEYRNLFYMGVWEIQQHAHTYLYDRLIMKLKSSNTLVDKAESVLQNCIRLDSLFFMYGYCHFYSRMVFICKGKVHVGKFDGDHMFA